MAEDEQEPDQSYWAKGKGKPKGKKGGKFKSKGKFKFGKDDYDSKGKDGKGKSKIKVPRARTIGPSQMKQNGRGIPGMVPANVMVAI